MTHDTAFLEQHLCPRGGEERREGGGGGGAENGRSVNRALYPPMFLDPEQMIETRISTTGNSVASQYSAPRILCRKSYSLNGPKPARFRILRNRLATRFTLSGLPVIERLARPL